MAMRSARPAAQRLPGALQRALSTCTTSGAISGYGAARSKTTTASREPSSRPPSPTRAPSIGVTRSTSAIGVGYSRRPATTKRHEPPTAAPPGAFERDPRSNGAGFAGAPGRNRTCDPLLRSSEEDDEEPPR
jgi:hypothetical protein